MDSRPYFYLASQHAALEARYCCRRYSVICLYVYLQKRLNRSTFRLGGRTESRESKEPSIRRGGGLTEKTLSGHVYPTPMDAYSLHAEHNQPITQPITSTRCHTSAMRATATITVATCLNSSSDSEWVDLSSSVAFPVPLKQQSDHFSDVFF